MNVSFCLRRIRREVRLKIPPAASRPRLMSTMVIQTCSVPVLMDLHTRLWLGQWAFWCAVPQCRSSARQGRECMLWHSVMFYKRRIGSCRAVVRSCPDRETLREWMGRCHTGHRTCHVRFFRSELGVLTCCLGLSSPRQLMSMI